MIKVPNELFDNGEAIELSNINEEKNQMIQVSNIFCFFYLIFVERVCQSNQGAF